MATEIDVSAFSRLLEAFGRAIGLPGLGPDAAGFCSLRFDQHLVNLQQDPAGREVTLFTHLGDLPEDASSATLRKLLAANLFWTATSGATLALEEASGGVALALRLPLDHLSEVEFEHRLSDFVNAVERWKGFVATLTHEGGAPAATGAVPQFGVRA